jgi:hypothetical protein
MCVRFKNSAGRADQVFVPFILASCIRNSATYTGAQSGNRQIEYDFVPMATLERKADTENGVT